MEGKKKDVKAGVVQTVQNVVGSSAKQSPNVGVLCMMLLVALRGFFLKACGIPLHGRSSGQLLLASPCGSTVVARKVGNVNIPVLNF